MLLILQHAHVAREQTCLGLIIVYWLEWACWFCCGSIKGSDWTSKLLHTEWWMKHTTANSIYACARGRALDHPSAHLLHPLWLFVSVYGALVFNFPNPSIKKKKTWLIALTMIMFGSSYMIFIHTPGPPWGGWMCGGTGVNRTWTRLEGLCTL